jgi:hypothetical protein
MTDNELLSILQETESRCNNGRQTSMRDALEFLDRATRGRCNDHQQRQAVYVILNDLSRGTMRQLDETIEVLGQYLYKTHRDRSGTTQAYQRLQEQMLAPITKAEMADLTKHIMTKTSIELFAEAEAAAILEAKAAAAAKQAEHIEYLKTLANATLHLLNGVSGGTLSDSGQRVLVKFRKELQPLALELGYRIVFTGDRSTAVLVQA